MLSLETDLWDTPSCFDMYNVSVACYLFVLHKTLDKHCSIKHKPYLASLRYSTVKNLRTSLVKQQSVVTHTISQSEVSVLDSAVTNSHAVKILYHNKNCLSLYYRKNMTCLNVGLLRICQAFYVSCKNVYRWVIKVAVSRKKWRRPGHVTLDVAAQDVRLDFRFSAQNIFGFTALDWGYIYIAFRTACSESLHFAISCCPLITGHRSCFCGVRQSWLEAEDTPI